MTLADSFVYAVTAMYTVTSLIYGVQSDWPRALIFGAYAVANIGIILAK